MHAVRKWSALFGFVLAACSASRSPSPDASADGASVTQPVALVTLDPIEPGAPELAVSGQAILAATGSGVDLQLTMRGCTGLAEKPIRILEARSCEDVSADSETWDETRGEGIPGVRCTGSASGEGLARYSRPSTSAQAWTLGDGSSTDIVGHAIALFDSVTREPSACGVIERAADRTLTPLPPEDEAPSLEARAQLGGLCLTRLMPGAESTDCIDPAGTSECANEHCNLGACLQLCEAYTQCLDEAADPCDAAYTCEASPECAECQTTVTSCSYGFCGAYLACPSAPRPDGPCGALLACCALQGEGAADCIEVARLLASLGGEGSCVSSLADWDFVAHMHVPCNSETAVAEGLMPDTSEAPDLMQGEPCVTQQDCDSDEVCFGASQGSILSSPGRCHARVATPQLDDHAVGAACTTDDSCGGGQCASQTALRTPYPDGYCSGPCYDDAICGEGSVCLLPMGASDPGRCMQACESDAQCPRDHYRCTPFGDGERVIHACYPREDALPDDIAGDACESDDDCEGIAGSCLEGMTLSFLTMDEIVPAPGGYCSSTCLYDDDCGQSAQCISGGISGGICMVRCDDNTPCRDGYRCVPHGRDLDDSEMVCMPIWDAR